MTSNLHCQCAGGSTHGGASGRECCDLCGLPVNPRWRFRFLLSWPDFWVGVFWDRRLSKLYVLPLPCVGIVLNFGDNP